MNRRYVVQLLLQFIKAIEFLSQTLIFLSRYHCNPMLYRPLIFQTMNYVRSNNHNLKYQRFTSSDRKDVWIRHSLYLYEIECPVIFPKLLGPQQPILPPHPPGSQIFSSGVHLNIRAGPTFAGLRWTVPPIYNY